MNRPRYALTFDIDWAPDCAIEACLSALSTYNVKATFFTTHHTDLNQEIVRQGHELGIHPNFLPHSSQGNNVREIIDSCLAYAPNAWCMRTHALVQSSPLLHEIFSHTPQLTLDVSLFMHKAKHVQKSKWAFDGVSCDRLLYNWEDDAEFESGDFSDTAQKFFGDLTVFNFHPLHVFLNAPDGSKYKQLKKVLRGRALNELKEKELLEFQSHGAGAKSFLLGVLTSDAESIALSDIT